MTIQDQPLPWALFMLGYDRPWACPDCFRFYRESTYEEQARFRIAFSDRGAEYLSGATISKADPPPGAICRCCWRTAS